jgi:hypothetical protein
VVAAVQRKIYSQALTLRHVLKTLVSHDCGLVTEDYGAACSRGKSWLYWKSRGTVWTPLLLIVVFEEVVLW